MWFAVLVQVEIISRYVPLLLIINAEGCCRGTQFRKTATGAVCWLIISKERLLYTTSRGGLMSRYWALPAGDCFLRVLDWRWLLCNLDSRQSGLVIGGRQARG
jgi:hypothetical protein